MYTPLFNRTSYTLLSSLLKTEDLVEYAKKNNIPVIAIADSNMYGTMEFIKKCNSENIKPVIGLECLLENYHIVLYAKNYSGYQNLMKLSTIQSERLINEKDLLNYKDNLYAIIEFKYQNEFENIRKIYNDLFIGYTNKKEEKTALVITKNVVFFQENLYKEKQDQNLLTYLYKIRDGKTVLDEVDYEVENHELYIENILDKTDNVGMINSNEIASNCNIEFPKAENLLPIFDCENPEKYLFELCKAGLTKRLNGQIPDKYKERLVHELKVINQMGFPNYFLIVYDFIKFAKKQKILVGPGRGSAAGSLVAYSLGITDIDPLKYDLLFERFLNPERKTMPDIDTDFPDNKRDIVINYVKEKYGEKRVSGIITFGTMSAKQVIRDVSRVLNIPLYKVDSLLKLIPQITKDNLKTIYENNLTFKTRIESDISLKEMFDIAVKLEGYPRHTSQHPAGIIMSRVNLDEVVPLTKTDDIYVTSYPMEYLEELGLLKMDFLVIKNLTLIDNVLNDIKEYTNEEVDFQKIPLDDENTLKMFETGNTCGIFQFETTGMRNYLKRLRPTSFDDIFAAIALYRPGAAGSIDSFVKRKHGEEPIEYLDPALEKVTKSTYGLFIYQEQIIELAHIYAGYTLGEADILRRAMSKKKEELLKAEEDKFISKSLELNHSYEDAKKVFDLILKFAGYGFNKSHSVVYSIIAYKMAYLKCYYKTIFYSNLLTNVIGSETKTNEYIIEAKSEKIEIVKPTINNSESRYKVEDNKIIYPISNIKGIGVAVSERIDVAKKDGPFTDIYDAFSRLYISGITKKVFETLIYADVFKEFNINRKTLIDNLDSLYNYAELTKDIDPSLVIKPEIEMSLEYEDSYLLEKEKEVFGFYLSQHPTTIYKKDNPYCIPIDEISKYYNKTVDNIILIEKIKVINTKKGDKMAFITGSDETGSKDFIVFPAVYKVNEKLDKGMIIKVRGRVEKRLNEIQVIVDRIKYLQGEENDE